MSPVSLFSILSLQCILSSQFNSNQKNVKSGVTALSSTSSSFGTAAASTKFDIPTNGNIDENLKAQALAEEEAAMHQYKSKVSSPTASGGVMTNPFLSSPVMPCNIVDLFGANDVQLANTTKVSDDLLQLSNPFADMFRIPQSAAVVNAVPTTVTNSWISSSNGLNGSSSVISSVEAAPTTNNSFVSDCNFSSVFGSAEPVGFDALGDVLTPGYMGPVQTSATIKVTSQQTAIPGSSVLLPAAQPTTSNHQPSKVLTGDLDSSLASLAESLSINKGSSHQIKNVLWNSPKNTARPGSAGWSPQPQPATNQTGYKPMQGIQQMRPMMGNPSTSVAQPPQQVMNLGQSGLVQSQHQQEQQQ